MAVITANADETNETEIQMTYRLHGTGPQKPDGTTLFAPTADDAVRKLDELRELSGKDGSVIIYDNEVAISEEDLRQEAKRGSETL